MNFELLSTDPRTDPREHYLLALPDFSSWPESLELAKPGFILFLVGDATRTQPSVLRDVADSAIRQGAIYVCAWGPGCEDVETAFDLAQVDREMERDEKSPLIVTTSHREETLAEAAWFSLFNAFPDPELDDVPECWLGVCFGQPESAERLRQWILDIASLHRAAGVVG